MHDHRSRFNALLGLAAVLLVVVGCNRASEASSSGADPARSAPAGTEESVAIEDLQFSPTELTVPAGSTVTWENRDDLGHTVTHGEDGAPASGALFDAAVNAEQVVTYTFEDPGTYPVTCKVHKDMQMTVTVEEP